MKPSETLEDRFREILTRCAQEIAWSWQLPVGNEDYPKEKFNRESVENALSALSIAAEEAVREARIDELSHIQPHIATASDVEFRKHIGAVIDTGMAAKRYIRARIQELTDSVKGGQDE